MHVRSRDWTRGAAIACAVLACACDVYESRLGGQLATDASANGWRTDAELGEEEGGDRCSPALARRRDGCRPGCGDTCNGRDDDCDGVTDEASADESCEVPNASATCRQGICLLTGCRDGYRDCDQLADNGCEVSQNDPLNCGACGHVCEATNADFECREGQCSLIACRDAYADCDGDGQSCETPLGTPSDCGACGDACAAGPNATARCTEGECTAPRCDGGFADCNGDLEDGCEQRLETLDHCGGCGVTCDRASCRGGVCTAADCGEVPDSADCDGDTVSCEVDLRSDRRNCGTCGTTCEVPEATANAHAACENGECRMQCDRGYGDCDEDPANGCERALNTKSNCGGCGVTCSIPDAAEACEDLRCVVSSCNADFADCDADGRSCETRLDTITNCGRCGARCNLPHAEQSCAGPAGERSCAITSCEPGWADCDGVAANGCERDTRTAGAGGGGPCFPEPNCRRTTRDGHEYFVCPTARGWQAARDLCRTQRGGDLAVISSAAEAEFVASMLRARHWIGHTDLNREGLWVWSRTGVPFWRGENRGAPIKAIYSRWALGEPNGSGDCGALYTNGLFDDHVCTVAEPYVCEVAADACPDDPLKWDPGQCGCGRADVDRTGDGLADCGE